MLVSNSPRSTQRQKDLVTSKNPASAKSMTPLTAPHIFSASAVFRNAQYGTTRGITSQRLRQVLRAFETDFERYAFLRDLQDSNETLMRFSSAIWRGCC